MQTNKITVNHNIFAWKSVKPCRSILRKLRKICFCRTNAPKLQDSLLSSKLQASTRKLALTNRNPGAKNLYMSWVNNIPVYVSRFVEVITKYIYPFKTFKTDLNFYISWINNIPVYVTRSPFVRKMENCHLAV